MLASTQNEHNNYKKLLLTQDSSDQDDYDTFLDKALSDNLDEEFDLIVMPLTLSDINPIEYSGIRCAAHIRLDRRFNNSRTPILFVGPDSLEEVLKISELGSFLLTPGVFLFNDNSWDQLWEWIGQNIKERERLSDSDYDRFLNRFEVKAPANFADDHHSIANLWGATVLCRRITKVTPSLTGANADALRSLFFKYVIAKNEISIESISGNIKESETLALGKSFLLIDDEADKGWGFALSNYLDGKKQFDIIQEKVACFEDLSDAGRNKIEKGKYDIIFLDLRLNGPEEEDVIDPEKFSGMSVLRRIKEINRGTQVIMFTASNKAWNLKALLDAGADGYYIKQSPEYFTEQSLDNNFISLKEAIRYCLKRSFLKETYPKIKELNRLCELSEEEEFFTRVAKYFDQSFILLSTAGDSTQYKYAFLSLFGVLEELVKYYIIPCKRDDRLYYFDNDPVNAWDIDKPGRQIINKGKAYGDLAIARKIIAIYMDRLGGVDVEWAKRIYNLASRRNDFVHNSESQLPYREISTPMLGDRHSYQDLFEVIEVLVEDYFTSS